MGQHELEKALRREGDEQARAIWQTAEQFAEQHRREIAARLRDLEEQAGRRQSALARRLREEVRSAAQQAARTRRLAIEQQLAERLRVLAAELLTSMTKDRDALFVDLATEVPNYPWQRVTVHSCDHHLAARHFPGAEIATEDSISAGMAVQDEEGRLSVDNTLEARLEGLWENLLAELFRDINERIRADAVANNPPR